MTQVKISCEEKILNWNSMHPYMVIQNHLFNLLLADYTDFSPVRCKKCYEQMQEDVIRQDFRDVCLKAQNRAVDVYSSIKDRAIPVWIVRDQKFVKEFTDADNVIRFLEKIAAEYMVKSCE